MQPTEPTPSPDVHEAAPPDAPESSPESTDNRPSPSWWQRLTGQRPREESEPSPEETVAAQLAASQRTLTEEEFQRAVQSEADKRIARLNKDARDAERRQLRDTDPWAYAQRERDEELRTHQAAETDTQLTQLFSTITAEHDKVSLDPIRDVLPQAELERIAKLPGVGDGMEGRKRFTEESLKALEKHWRAEGAREAESKLRRNPAFRKSVMSELSGGYPEPELLPSGAAPANGSSSEQINDMLRRQIGVHRQT